MRTLRCAIYACLVSLGLFFPVSPGAADEQRITFGLTNRSGSVALPHVVAEEKGFFKAEGLNVSLIVMQNQVVVNALAAKNIDYGGTFSNMVGAALSGLPIRIVAVVMEGGEHVLVTHADIKRVEDLKGKIVGISSFGGAPHMQVTMILRKYGLNPEKDVTFLQIGGTPSRYAALESGSVQAVMLQPPFNKMAQKRGFREIIAFNEILKVPLGGVAVHRDRIREKPDEIVRLIRAILKGIDYIHTHKDDILRIMEKSWGIKDREIREQVYRDALPIYARNGTVPDDLMRQVVQMIQGTRKTSREVPLSDIVEWRFARQAAAELSRK
ncbi:MAG TPA: ABC transporter substrate-binding protein [candidate division Zixibacteria bacterium]|nr:ABC transporter substrate-binding protein [candidate division Zixibacteria bacterium]